MSSLNIYLPQHFREFLIVNLDDLIRLKHASVKGRNKARDSEGLSFLQKLKAGLTKSEKS